MADDTAPQPGDAIASTATSLLGHDSRSIVPFLRQNGQSLDAIHQNWCAAFTNGVLAANGVEGVQGSRKNIATSFLNWGQPAQGEPQRGDVLVLPRGRQPGQIGGHVGIATGQVADGPSGTFYLMQSGNENGRVAYSWEPAGGVVARRAPATSGTKVVAQAPSSDDLMERMRKLAPQSASQPATDGAGAAAPATAAQDATPSSDDLMARMRAMAPSPATTETTTTTQETAPPAGVGIGGKPAESALQTFQRWFGAGGPPAKSSPLADVITSPDAVAADRPPGEAPPSLEDVRGRIQQGEINILQALAPGPDAGPIENFARKAAAVPIHMLAGAAQLPFNALIGIKEGPSGGVTWNPETGTYGLTPEAMAAAQLLTGGGPAGRDIRFSGNNPLQHLPGGTFEFRSPVVSVDELAAAIRRAGETSPSEATTTMPGGAQGAKDDIPTTIVRPGPTGESAASIEASGGYKPGAGVSGPTEGGAPQPAGAQVTPGYEAIHTPAEEAAYRATAEGRKLLEPQVIGEQDLNQYIPGETVNNAAREQTAKAARELKELGIRVPEASQLDKEAEQSNNTARTIYAENTAKGPNDIHARTVDRETDINADKAKVFSPDNVKGDVDLAPVIEHMEAVLNDPFNRQNSALKTVYAPLLERIKNANIKDPMEAWSLRRDIDKMTSARMKADNPYLHEVAHDLDGVSNVIDKQIEDVAPGYDKMLATYKEHSRAITEMTALQGALKNLRGPGQMLTYNDFQRFMRDVVKGRMSPPTDLNAFKTISPENIQRLWNIRDSLRRTASAKELARAAGSDTMPNIIDALKAVGKMGGSAALHAYVGAHLGPGGNLALQSLGAIGKSLNDRRMIRRAVQQMQNLLNPPMPLRIPPGQENPLSGAPQP